MIKIKLSGTPPLPNVMRTWHWAKRAREAKKWREMSAWEAKRLIKLELFQPDDSDVDLVLFENKTYAIPLKEVSLTITRGASRPCDIDNGIASCKPIIDGLKDAGLIEDDNPGVVRRITFNQVKTKRDQTYVEIKVIPLQD